MVAILMISAKLATLGYLKIKVFWNKGYDVIISAHDVTNIVLLIDSKHIVDVVMRTNFGSSRIFMREVMIPTIYKDLTWKINFFEGCCSFKFRLTLVMALEKGLKRKVRKFLGLTPTL